MPSGPEAMLRSITSNKHNTSSSVQKMALEGIVEQSTMKFCAHTSVSGGTAELKLRHVRTHH